MVFSSNVFLFCFLPLVLLLHTLLPFRTKNLLLLVASIFFYAWGEKGFVLVILLSISGNYILARGYELGFNATAENRKLWFALIVGFNLLPLIYFKYAVFAGALIKIQLTEIHLPIGISFFTFQSLSYQYELYKKQIDVEKNLLHLGLYISLFPQLIAGPIVRYTDVVKELVVRNITSAKIQFGIQKFVVGLFKKVVIANTLGALVVAIQTVSFVDMPSHYAILMVLAYAFQLYFDFSGYSDMAIGLGKILGFNFPENFNLPYAARNMRDFWRRWHISLSTWFRDYLYIPLGGSKSGRVKTYLNLLIVFFLTGLWHGAGANFVIWGLFHGFFLILERILGAKFPQNRIFGSLYVWMVFLSGWIFFMTDSLEDSCSIFKSITSCNWNEATQLPLFSLLNKKYAFILFLAIITSVIRPKLPRMTLRRIIKLPYFRVLKCCFKICVLVITSFMFFTAVMFISGGTYNPFIYFRF